MAFNRCYTTYNSTIQSSSDYSSVRRQKTIYSDVASTMNSNGTANPKKKGFYYNNNFGVIPLSSGPTAGCLAHAKNYELLLDVTKGKHFYDVANGIDSSQNSINTNDLWAGNLFSVNYATKGIGVVVDTSYGAPNANTIVFPQPLTAGAADLVFNNSYPGVIVDPSYAIFYNSCLGSYNDGKNPWLHLVDVSFNTTSYYNGAIKGDPLYNMSYPEKVIFSCK